MKVLLVNLNRVKIPAISPYAIDLIASNIVRSGHNVDFLDLTPSDEPQKDIKKYFENNEPDLVGLSLRNLTDLYFPSWMDLPHRGTFLDSHKEMIDYILMYTDISKVIVGGVGFSSNPKEILERLGLKYGITGPGEEEIVNLINQMQEEEGSTLKDLLGDFGIVDGRSSCVNRKIERSFVDNEWYYKWGGLGNVRMSNGCDEKCSFCCEPFAKGNEIHTNDVENVLYEIDQLIEMGVYDIHTADSEFNHPFDHSKEVLKGIIDKKYPSNVRFWGYCTPTPFDEEYAGLLGEAGFTGINFGTEHSDPEMLGKMNKWYRFEDIKRTTELCHQNGIAVMHELLFGYPGDSPQRMFACIDEIRALEPRVVGVTIGIGILKNTQLEKESIKKMNEEGTYIEEGGTLCLDPSFFIDPSFNIPGIYSELMERYEDHTSQIMLPQLQSIESQNNQLVGSERVKDQLKRGLRGAFWYYFPTLNQ